MKNNIYKVAQVFENKLKQVTTENVETMKKLRDAANKLHLLKEIWYSGCGPKSGPLLDTIKSRTNMFYNSFRMYGLNTDQMTNYLNQLRKAVNALWVLPCASPLDPMATDALIVFKKALDNVVSVTSAEISRQLGM